MARNLNSQLVRAMIVLTLIAFAVMYAGWFVYYSHFYDILYPNGDYSENVNAGDLIVTGVILSIGLITAAIVGWRLAQNIVKPLKTIADAVHSIAGGDFSARAETIGTAFSEAQYLITDFNAMAALLENAEAELKYSNSAVAHELRTPLTILRGRLQGLADGAFKPSPELYGRLISHVEDLTRIVEDLRILGLSSAGKLELKLDRIDLAVETAAVTDSVEQDLVGAGIGVERNLDPVIVFADKARIRQILFAVLDNARRYAPGSTVLVRTFATREKAFILCSDNGPGFPAGAENRVFERFWRGDDSRARASGGSGLGLPVVQAIARAHGGDARVFPNNGSGAAIEIWLPAANEPTKGSSASMQFSQTPNAGSSSRKMGRENPPSAALIVRRRP